MLVSPGSGRPSMGRSLPTLAPLAAALRRGTAGVREHCADSRTPGDPGKQRWPPECPRARVEAMSPPSVLICLSLGRSMTLRGLCSCGK